MSLLPRGEKFRVLLRPGYLYRTQLYAWRVLQLCHQVLVAEKMFQEFRVERVRRIQRCKGGKPYSYCRI